MMYRNLLIALLLALVVPAFATKNDSLVGLRFSWVCENSVRACTVEIPSSLIDYYRNDRDHLTYHYSDMGTGRHEELSDFYGFVFSEYDREVVASLARQMEDSAATNYEKALVALTFVQSLPYVTDKDSKGQQEYVRFPVETLVDGVGDCEDKVILLSAILGEMGIGFILMQLPDHTALGVDCEAPHQGTRIGFGGSRYYFVETTTLGWKIGQVPDEYQAATVEVVPLTREPLLVVKEMHFQTETVRANKEARCQLQMQLYNAGPGRLTGLGVHVWVVDRHGKQLKEETLSMDDLLEGKQRDEVLKFKSVISKGMKVKVVVFGDQITDKEFEMR